VIALETSRCQLKSNSGSGFSHRFRLVRSAAPIPTRIVFPTEALENAAFAIGYSTTLAFGDQALDARHELITFFHPGVVAGRIPALENPLRAAGLPYNLHRFPLSNSVVELDDLLMWRPSSSSPVALFDRRVWLRSSELRAHAERFDIDVRRACDRFVYGQQSLFFVGLRCPDGPAGITPSFEPARTPSTMPQI
jgi:hypothetical protein